MLQVFRQHPWLWVVLLLALGVCSSIAFVCVCLAHPPVPAGP